MEDSRKKVFLLASLWSAWCIVFLLRMSIKAILPALKAEFEATHLELGLIISTLIIAYSFMQLPAGYLADRIKKKYIIIPGILLSSIAIFLASYSQNIIVLIFLLSFVGLGLGTYYPPGIGLISEWFSRERRGKAFGLHETATSAGSIIGPILSSLIVSLYGWRLGFKSLGLITLIPLPLLYLFGNQKTSNEQKDNQTSSINIKPLVPLIIIFALTAAGWMGFTTYLTSYLTSIGFSEGVAGAMFSIMPAISFFSMPLAGHLSDKFSRKIIIIILLFTSSPFIYLVSILNSPYLIIICLIINGLTLSGAYPVVITYFSDKIPYGVTGTTFGVINAISMGFSSIASPAIGYLIDLFDYQIAFLSLSGLIVVSGFIILME